MAEGHLAEDGLFILLGSYMLLHDIRFQTLALDVVPACLKNPEHALEYDSGLELQEKGICIDVHELAAINIMLLRLLIVA